MGKCIPSQINLCNFAGFRLKEESILYILASGPLMPPHVLSDLRFVIDALRSTIRPIVALERIEDDARQKTKKETKRVERKRSRLAALALGPPVG